MQNEWVWLDNEAAEQDAADIAAQAGAGDGTFASMFEGGGRNFQSDQVVQGTVLRVTPDFVVVDIGYKSEGEIPIHEFRVGRGEVSVSPGDRVSVYIEELEDEEGEVVLSKERADQLKVWDDVSAAFDEGRPVEGRIVQRVKGGLSVDVGGVHAFLPGSQVDLRPVRNLDRMIGETHTFKILKLNKRRGNIVLSRRVILEDQRETLKAETLATLAEGQIREGVVKNNTDYGSFIDLGGIDGLLHITDMSWGRISHPSDLFKVGDRVKVMVLKFDRERERVSLGYKQITPDPWTNVEDKYPVSSRVKGKVVSLTDYGAFVELEQGIEGLIHISEMSWTKKVKHPSQVLSVGDEIETMILNVDRDNQRISLGLKQTEANPWQIVRQTYPPGTKVKGVVRNITDFGVFVGIEEGIDGLVHISDISWTQKVNHPSDVFQKGQEVEAVVLNVDVENERFSLGIKQLDRDPWEAIPAKFPTGKVIEGKVTNVAEFGAFVELEPGIEGLIHITEVSKDKVADIRKALKPGDTVKAQVISIDPRERKIGLSIRALEDADHRANLEAYRQRQGDQRGFGGTLAQQLQRAQEQIRAAEQARAKGGESEEEEDKS